MKSGIGIGSHWTYLGAGNHGLCRIARIAQIWMWLLRSQKKATSTDAYLRLLPRATQKRISFFLYLNLSKSYPHTIIKNILKRTDLIKDLLIKA